MSGTGATGVRSAVFGQNSQPAPSSGGAGDLSPLGLLYAYRANPFNLNTPMAPRQANTGLFLPPALPTVDYSAQYRASHPVAPAPTFDMTSPYPIAGGDGGDSGGVGDSGGDGGGGGGGGGK